MTSEAIAGRATSGHRRPRSRRLRRDEEIRAVFAGGRSAHNKTLSVYARPSPSGMTRSTVVAGRKVGGAVARNRAKRRLRAALQGTTFPEGYDVVVVARSRCLCLSFGELEATLAEQVRRSVSSCAEHEG